MEDNPDLLRQEYTIDTPENVTFGYEVAGIGHRFIGALVDSTLLGVTLTLLTVAMVVLLGALEGPEVAAFSADEEEVGWAGGLVLAFYALATFAIIWGYFILFELLWHGRTPGKRVARTRVVCMDGSPAGAIEVVVRNLVRFIDFLPFAYGVGLITMFANDRARRLGDFAAGTLVVKDRLTTAKEALDAAPRPAAGLQAAGGAPLSLPAADLRVLTDAESALIRDVLQRHAAGTAPDSLVLRLAAAMAATLQVAPPRANQSDSRQFLNQLLDAAPSAGSGLPPIE